MPSLKAPPVGSIPAPGDVKPSVKPSQTEEPDPKVAAAVASDPTPTKEPEVDESDLEVLEEGKKIPYQRFKEKVDETKSLKQQIDVMKRQTDLALSRAAEDAEIRVKARLEKEKENSQLEELDPTERRVQANSREVSDLRAELNQMRLNSENQEVKTGIERLERKYPEADSLAVLGWAKAQGLKPNNSEAIEELMEKSHNLNIDRAKSAVQKILEHKKAKAKAAVPTREGGIRLKDGERPKNLKEAAALTRRFYEGGGEG